MNVYIFLKKRSSPVDIPPWNPRGGAYSRGFRSFALFLNMKFIFRIILENARLKIKFHIVTCRLNNHEFYIFFYYKMYISFPKKIKTIFCVQIFICGQNEISSFYFGPVSKLYLTTLNKVVAMGEILQNIDCVLNLLKHFLNIRITHGKNYFFLSF